MCFQSITLNNNLVSSSAACGNSSADWTSNSAELQTSLRTPFTVPVHQQQQQQKRAIACVPPMTWVIMMSKCFCVYLSVSYWAYIMALLWVKCFLRSESFSSRRIKYAGWLSEWLSMQFFSWASTATEAAKETKFGTKVAQGWGWWCRTLNTRITLDVGWQRVTLLVFAVSVFVAVLNCFHWTLLPRMKEILSWLYCNVLWWNRATLLSSGSACIL